jgi:glucan endo-1,3-beta-D-glucosidase
VASVENAKKFWDDVGCSLFGKVNTWWYILRDSNPENTALFAITENLSTRPIFDLTCPPESERPTASSSSSGSTASSTSSVGGGSASPATGGEDSTSPSSSSTGAQASGNGAGALAPGSFVAAVVLAAAAVFLF